MGFIFFTRKRNWLKEGEKRKERSRIGISRNKKKNWGVRREIMGARITWALLF